MGTPRHAPHIRLVGRAGITRWGRQDGSIGIMTIGAVIAIIGFCGLALDLPQVFNRKIELQNAADASALAAANALNGTKSGVVNAVQAASGRFSASKDSAVTFQYGRAMAWADTAIEFSSTPSGPWQSVSAAKDNPGELGFVRVSTAGLDASYGEVRMLFVPFFTEDLAKVSVSASAIAGRSAIKVAPLAICAMRPEEKRDRSGELEEYGFRRGISYDLMDLNSEPGSARSFLIDPLFAPGTTATSTSDLHTVEPFVCTGTLGIRRVTGGKVAVSSPFPLSSLVDQLNSRFKANAAKCNTDTSPPDANVKAYVFNTSVPWMSTARAGQSATFSTAESKRWTIAGPDPTPTDTTVDMYGPLWSYAKAVQYASTEPSGGYTAYAPANWSTLYNPGQPKATSYPSNTPYMATNGSVNFEAPTGSNKGVRHRRVLNVPLLECPVSANRATVLGIGKFFMTVPADSTHLYAEFAGLVAEQSLNIQMRLYP